MLFAYNILQLLIATKSISLMALHFPFFFVLHAPRYVNFHVREAKTTIFIQKKNFVLSCGVQLCMFVKNEGIKGKWGRKKSESNLRMKLKAPTDAFKFYANSVFFSLIDFVKKNPSLYTMLIHKIQEKCFEKKTPRRRFQFVH